MNLPAPEAPDNKKQIPQLLPLAQIARPTSLSATSPGATAGKVLVGLIAVALLGVAVWSSGGFAISGPKHDPLSFKQDASLGENRSIILPVARADWDQAIGQLMTSEADKARVRSGLQNGSLRLGTVTVSDFDAEDGDWVSIIGAGVKQDVQLFKKPFTVTVPYVPGSSVSVIGRVDGGGGDITVSVHVGSSALPLRALKPGESVAVPTP
jgi:hypothetical protein